MDKSYFPIQLPAPPAAILLFDDACIFCSALTAMILRYDKKGSLCFAPLGGLYATALRQQYAQLRQIDSLVWVGWDTERTTPQILTHSDAALQTAAYLGGVFRLLTIARFIPKKTRDTMYCFFARHRHRFFSASRTCMLLTPEQRKRFIP